ncbi:hypothetical protein [Flavobacterium rhizosphaerae]|uniref:DUF695 domain-containing protein n=1 Tax=Flavobacterium rhizosphaerae TaxID=3163298 RepID=A0ABW8YV90_9FLAO
MSYDLMAFRPEAAPEGKKEFSQWYAQQTEWTEDHDYNDPENTSEALKTFIMEMQQTFPSLNDLDDNDDDPKGADYSIGIDVIYVAFGFSEAEDAYTTMFTLAAKHQIGFYDPQSDQVFVPDGVGGLKNMNSTKRTWWKFW